MSFYTLAGTGGTNFHLTISPEAIMTWCSIVYYCDYNLVKSSSWAPTYKEENIQLWQVERASNASALRQPYKKKSGTVNLSIHEHIFHWIQYIGNDPYESNWNKNRFEIYCCVAIINLSGEHRHIPRCSLKSFIKRSHFTFEYFKAFCLLILA